jgi:diguanylate cyclase (GGDEF)-like protein
MSHSQLPRRTAMVRRVLDVLPQEIALLARDGTIVWVNAAWRQFAANNSGPVSAAVGWNYLDVCRRAVESGEPVARSVLGALSAAVEGEDPGAPGSWEYTCHAPGVQRWFQATVRSMADPESALRSTGALVIHEDITARILAERASRRQAFDDPLTGLANELHFNDRAARAIAAAPRMGRRAGVVLVDVPDAENAGDGGPPQARRQLRAAGQRLRAEVRLPDLVARWTASTLVVLVEDVRDLADLVVVAERLGAAVTEAVAQARSARSKPSAPPAIGLAASRATDTPQDLVSRAEAALARCRARGQSWVAHSGDAAAELLASHEPGDVIDLRDAAKPRSRG